MDNFKEWLKAKGKEGPTILVGCFEDKNPTSWKYNTVVTPQNVPEFHIPSSVDSSPNRSPTLDLAQEDGGHSPLLSPCYSPRSSSPENSRAQRSKSMPDSPNKYSDNEDVPSVHSMEDFKSTTNSDPKSSAAMELPHFKAKTYFGFDTLTQAPHTRRRESLFFSQRDPDLFAIEKLGDTQPVNTSASHLRRSKSCRAPSKSFQSKDVKERLSTAINIEESTMWLENGANLNTLLLEQEDPTRKSSLKRSKSLFRRLTQKRLGSGDDNGQNFLDTSFLTGENSTLGRVVSVSGTSTRSPKSLPSSKSSLSVSSMKESQQVEIGIGTKTNMDLDLNLGKILFSLQYFPLSSKIKVTIIKATELRIPNGNPFITLYLLPGKRQKQSSNVLKQTQNPNFNQTFIFTNMEMEDMRVSKLSIQLYHKCHGFAKKDPLLGECLVALDKLDLVAGARLWQDLKLNMEDQR